MSLWVARDNDMRAFLLPDIVGPQAYQLLGPLLLIGTQPVVWRPSLHIIDRMHEAGRLFFGARDFLKLVRAKRVVVAARRQWFADPEARARVDLWNTEPWVTRLDDELANWAMADEQLLYSMRRVIVAPNSSGMEWAKLTATANPHYLSEAVSLYERRQLPAGYYRRLRGIRARDDIGHLILADARNASNALEETHCDLPVEPGRFATNMATLGNRPQSTRSSPSDLPTNDNLAEFLLFLRKLGRIEGFSDFERLLGKDELETISTGVAPFLNGPSGMRKLQSQLEATRLGITWSEALKPTPYSLANALVSAALSFAGGIADQSLLVGGLVASALSLPARLGEKLGLAPLADSGAIAWLSLCYYGRKSVSLAEAERMREYIVGLNAREVRGLLR